MLTQLSTVKARLALDEFDVRYDDLLTSALAAVSARFEKECNRNFGRAEIAEEFPGHALELRVARYPLAVVSRFELKSNETDGWVEHLQVEHLIRGSCVISLAAPLGGPMDQGRVTYIGGYVLPGNEAGPGQQPLPDDLEQAAVEQLAYWFQNRDQLGLVRIWPHQGTYQQFAQLDLLPGVQAVLRSYERWTL